MFQPNLGPNTHTASRPSEDGTDYSECSNDASVNVPAETLNTSTEDAPTDTALRHPVNLAASLLGGVVVLTWDAPVEGAESITGYEVLRRRPQNGEHTLVPYGQTTVGTTFIDLNATESGVKYVYRVKALRGDARSRWSNYDNVTIPE